MKQEVYKEAQGRYGVSNLLEESSDLTTNWSARAEMMEMDLPATNNVQFYRFRME